MERALQVSVVILIVFGSFLVCYEEGSHLLPLVALVVAPASIYFTDIKKWIHLNVWGRNVLSLVCAGFCLKDVLRIASDQQLLAMTYFLVCLQLILLLQKKTRHTYWVLIMVSLVVVAVAAALNISMLSGVLLVVYLSLVIGSLAIFFFHGEFHRLEAEALANQERATLVGANPKTLAVHSRWAWTGRPGEVEASLPSGVSVASGAAALSKPLSWAFGWQITRAGLGILAITFVVFVLTPRVGRSGSRFGQQQLATVGFSNSVQLGNSGEVQETGEQVLQLWLFHRGTRKPYELQQEPLLQGTVLTNYSHNREGRGIWGKASGEIKLWRASTPPEGVEAVEQELAFENPSANIVFCSQPAFNHERDPRLQIDEIRQQVYASLVQNSRRVRVLTLAYRNGRQLEIVPDLSGTQDDRVTILLQMPSAQLRMRLRKLAQSIVKDIPPENVVDRAKALERYFWDATLFRYSLTRPASDGSTDPVEEFLFNTRVGHCEYYASALALLLRSINIPCRLVLGYRGGDWNQIGGFYRVKEDHAHAWVQVSLKPDQVPAADKAQFKPAHWAQGGWLTLDPTPAIGGSLNAAGTSGKAFSLVDLWDYVQYLWTNYVLRMDSGSQAEGIYRPLLRLLQIPFQAETWQNLLGNLKRLLGVEGNSLSDWFNWRAGLFAMALSLLLYAAFKLLAAFKRKIQSWFKGSGSQVRRKAHVPVAFYRQLESWAAKEGLPREDRQTPREFALVLAAYLGKRAPATTLRLIPIQVVDAYYRVRYGGRPLTEPEASVIEAALKQLETVPA